MLATVLAAIARGEIAPAEGARIAERVRGRLRAPPGASHEWRRRSGKANTDQRVHWALGAVLRDALCAALLSTEVSLCCD